MIDEMNKLVGARVDKGVRMCSPEDIGANVQASAYEKWRPLVV